MTRAPIATGAQKVVDCIEGLWSCHRTSTLAMPMANIHVSSCSERRAADAHKGPQLWWGGTMLCEHFTLDWWYCSGLSPSLNCKGAQPFLARVLTTIITIALFFEMFNLPGLKGIWTVDNLQRWERWHLRRLDRRVSYMSLDSKFSRELSETWVVVSHGYFLSRQTLKNKNGSKLVTWNLVWHFEMYKFVN
jgi:hypothetical protein